MELTERIKHDSIRRKSGARIVFVLQLAIHLCHMKIILIVEKHNKSQPIRQLMIFVIEVLCSK